MIKNLIKPLLVAAASVSLLTGCFVQTEPRPRTKVIEYDEEVKLHDGSMIWVHIKRHYVLAGGGALGDPGAFKSNYVPKEVEISWDTGFPDVGRKSVFFQEQIWAIEKFNNEWYIYGGSDNGITNLQKDLSSNCNEVGTRFFQGDTCLVRLDILGKFIQSTNENLYTLKKVNVLYSKGFHTMEALENQQLTWQKKLDMQIGKSEKEQTINRKLFSN